MRLTLTFSRLRGLIPSPAGRGAMRPLSLGKIAKGTGVVILALVALDLLATTATLALGWGMFKR